MGSDAKERLLSMNPWVDLDWPERCKQAAARITDLEAALSAATAKVSRYEARLEIDHCFKLVGEDLVREEIPAEDRERFPDGILARDETIKLLERRVEAAERDSAKYRDYAAEKSNQYVQNLHELEMLKADFNDCNSERARHKAAREAAEAEAARLREALTPSGDTKAAYSGEIITEVRCRIFATGEVVKEDLQLPWVTIKDVMRMIARRAALGGEHG